MRLVYDLCIVWGFLIFHLPQFWLLWFLHLQEPGPGGIQALLFNIFLFTLWAVIHSLMARDVFKNLVARLMGSDFYKLVYITIAGLTQCLLLYFWQPLRGEIWHLEGVWYWLLTLAFLGTMAFGFYACLVLDYFEVLGLRVFLRRMRDEPDPEPRLSLQGPYAYCRHPVYLASLLFFWVGPVMTVNRLVFAISGTVYILIGTRLEERNAVRELGEDYVRYQENVPMIRPRLTPWRPDNVREKKR